MCHPLRANILTGPKVRRVSSVIIFLAGLVYNLPLWMESCLMTIVDTCNDIEHVKKVYRPQYNDVHYYNIYKLGCTITLMYVIPLTLLVVLNIKMIRVIRKSSRGNVDIRRHGG